MNQSMWCMYKQVDPNSKCLSVLLGCWLVFHRASQQGWWHPTLSGLYQWPLGHSQVPCEPASLWPQKYGTSIIIILLLHHFSIIIQLQSTRLVTPHSLWPVIMATLTQSSTLWISIIVTLEVSMFIFMWFSCDRYNMYVTVWMVLKHFLLTEQDTVVSRAYEEKRACNYNLSYYKWAGVYV